MEIFGCVNAASGAGTTIFTLPSGYIPAATFIAPCWDESSSVAQGVVVDTSGNVRVQTVTAGHRYDIAMRYNLTIAGT